MKQTTNYNLNKIELLDSPPDITVHSQNFDIIDEELKNNADAISSHLADYANHLGYGEHGNVSATGTDDATSPTAAPLKSAGGLAVAKSAYFGDKTVFPSFLNSASYKNLIGGVKTITTTPTEIAKFTFNNASWTDLAIKVRLISSGVGSGGYSEQVMLFKGSGNPPNDDIVQIGSTIKIFELGGIFTLSTTKTNTTLTLLAVATSGTHITNFEIEFSGNTSSGGKRNTVSIELL